ncbi:MAG: type II toxin-antitoxin system ParD family antitoxin [Bryobacter sp.]|nr:type II toxin-antitoxin system ParD family antitoxin [Bryobacter sp.]
MNVSLTPELEQLVNDKVKSGHYQTASEVVREGLRLLIERDQQRESLRSEIRAGFAAVDRGEFLELDSANPSALTPSALAERVKARGQQRWSAKGR